MYDIALHPAHPPQEWQDTNMVWDEAEYGGLKDIRMPPSSLWKPDILMYNRSPVTCHLSHNTCHLSPVTCHPDTLIP